MPRRWSDWQDFPTSGPREAIGGIKAASQRGAFGANWWAKRWIEVLESFQIGGRLQRGRSYARRGQVLKVEIEKGIVQASVQGSRPAPYDVSITVASLTGAQWKKIAQELGKQAIFAAKLLAGEMPHDIEKAFAQAGFSLFPEKAGDLTTSCSCPDWSNPCKHVAAVYYLLGEAFDRDPFLIFRMRGMDREEFLELLGAAASSIDEAAPIAPEPLPDDADEFWHGKPRPPELLGNLNAPEVEAALLKRLGALPFWSGEVPFFEALTPAYRGASARALRQLFAVNEKTEVV
ncbi:MAG: SWIM zinc finger family protein [Acidobacteriaceae bacterium]|nr:SWIM zinc finger family protein [Acidobacteriaceae bacterium]